MRSLFLKIFLSFWVALALFLVIAILLTLAFRPRSATWEALRTSTLNDSVAAYEEGGSAQLSQYFDNLEA
jgi:membrane protein implicated in regulation of membrane protease activity